MYVGTAEPRFRKYRSLDWISKRRTGFVKHGLIKRGFIKHESVKHGSMDKTCFINRCFTNLCFINPFFYLINVLSIHVGPTSPCSRFFPVTLFCLRIAISYNLSVVSVSKMNNDVNLRASGDLTV